MNVYVVGANGMLGRRIVSALSDRFTVTPISSSSPPGPSRLDLRNADAFDYDQVTAGDVVVLTAAISSPDRCAREFDLAHAVNVTGTIAAIERFTARGARTIFFSSDVVLGNSRSELFEDAPLRPIGPYADMKAAVERHFAGDPLVRILRLSYVISGDDGFLKYLGTCLREGRPAETFAALERRVVAVDDVIAAVEALCDHTPKSTAPLFNLAGPDLLSRKALADIYATATGGTLRVKPVEPPLGFFDARPEIINMGSHHLSALLGRPPVSAIRFIAGFVSHQAQPAS